jgi:hypothetical protein
MISTAHGTIGIYTLAVSAKMCNDNGMKETKLSSSYCQSVIADQLAAERREREAARAARAAGAVFTNWFISDRD